MFPYRHFIWKSIRSLDYVFVCYFYATLPPPLNHLHLCLSKLRSNFGSPGHATGKSGQELFSFYKIVSCYIYFLGKQSTISFYFLFCLICIGFYLFCTRWRVKHPSSNGNTTGDARWIMVGYKRRKNCHCIFSVPLIPHPRKVWGQLA